VTARRLGFVLALGTALVLAEDLRTGHSTWAETPFERSPSAPRPRHLGAVPAPAPEPAEIGSPALVEAPAPAEAGAQGLPRRRSARVGKAVLAVAALATWLWFLLPQAVGGRAAWVLVDGTSMLPHYHTGDLVLVERQSHYRIGQVIAYRVPRGDPMAGAEVIHRIVGGDALHGFVVQGDNRTAPDVWHPTPHDVVGRKLLRIPHALVVIQLLRSPLLLGLLAAAFAFASVLGRGREAGGPAAEADA
jgi:signal peptidase I